MKKHFIQTIVFFVACAVLVPLIGCDEKPINKSQEKLYAAENMELKKDISRLKEEHKKELAAKQNELENCRAENEKLEERLQRDNAKIMQESMIVPLMEQMQKLKAENSQLKAEIEALKQEQGE
jgi:hypothetical protein